MKYESEIRRVCGEDWKTITQEERDGGYGIAILIAYMRGVKPSIGDLARHLGATPDELSRPYVRLMRNGALGRDEIWKVKDDQSLTGHNGDLEAYRSWSFVAAVAGGFLGVPN
jgi:hypothetical protein